MNPYRKTQYREEAERITWKVLEDALALEPSEIQLGKSIADHLGAESIDYLDFIFKLEHEVGIKIPENSPLEVPGQTLTIQFEGTPCPQHEREKVIQRAGVRYNAMDPRYRKEFERTGDYLALGRGLNVEGLVRYVETLLEKKDAAAESRPARS